MCPNCGQPAKPEAMICPNCGAVSTYSWPPAPEGGPEPPAARILKTKSIAGDIVTGTLYTTLWCVSCGAGILMIPFMYNYERKIFPIYARAMGCTYIVWLILFVAIACGYLGTFQICGMRHA